MAATLTGDLVSKEWVFHSLLTDPVLQSRMAADLARYGDTVTARQALHSYHRSVCPGVAFTLSTNPGVAFGMPMYRWIIGLATVVMIALVFYFFATSHARAWAIHIALALLLGGALGNFYDRMLAKVVVPGFEPIRFQVRDFIDCSGLHYPWIFNLADVWLVVGVGILILHWLLGKKTPAPSA